MLKGYKAYIVVTSDEYLYDLFGLDGENEPMSIDKESISYLEDYLNDYDEDDEDDEPKMADEEVKQMFDGIKELLKEYKEVQVKYKK